MNDPSQASERDLSGDLTEGGKGGCSKRQRGRRGRRMWREAKRKEGVVRGRRGRRVW